MLIGGGAPTVVDSSAAGSPHAVPAVTDSSSYIYYNGSATGNGGVLQTFNLPTPPNGTVWDLVSADVTITSGSKVDTTQNADLYDSTCTQLDVAPAASNCKGIYGPNVDTLVNDVMTDGQSGTNTGSGGYSATEPAGLVQYFHWWQTIHMTYDTFWSFEALLSYGVSAAYHVVLDPEIGDYPSFIFYRWNTPVEPLSSSPTTVRIPGPPSGYEYRAEMAVSTIDLGSSSLAPSRSAELLEEPSGTVLSSIDSWTVPGPGVTEDACGGYSSGQSCASDPTGTGTVWEDQVVISSSESFEARFVGVSGDSGVYAVVVTEYPAGLAAPTGVAVTASTNSSLTWSWTNPGGALTDDYFFWEASSACSSPTRIDLGAVTDSHVVGSLAPDTEYCAYVEAVNATGPSPPSSTATGTTIAASVPGPPTDVSATPRSSSEIQLTWTNPSGPLSDDYVDRYAGSSCSGTSTVVNVGSVVSSYEVSDLSAETTYGFQVVAANSAGEGARSVCASATTEEAAPPAPTGLSATAASSSSIDLTWTNPSGTLSDDYVYTFSGSGCTGSSASTNLEAVQESYTSTGLSSSTTYSYEVAAANTAGESARSACAHATTDGVPPSAPSALSATAASTSSIDLLWTNPSGSLTDDYVYTYPDPGCTGSAVTTDLGAVEESYTSTGLTSFTAYGYEVAAANAAGEGAPSVCVNATTDEALPAAPTNLSATVVSAGSIDLAWTNPSGPLTDDYVYAFSDSACTGFNATTDLGAVEESYTSVGLQSSSAYSYEVAAVNGAGEGPLSACVSATTEETPPSAPTNLTAAAVSSSSIELVWTIPPGVVTDEYVYTYSDSGCAGSRLSADLGSVASSYARTGLSSATNYSFEVEAANSAGPGPASNCAAATTAAGNGGGVQNNTTVLDVTATTTNGSVVPGVAVDVELLPSSENLSILLEPTNDSGNATYIGLPTGATIANVTLIGENYSINSYLVSAAGANVVEIRVVVTPLPEGENSTSTDNWVRFVAQGLSTRATWWVNVTGPESENLSASGTSIAFQLENGTYDYALGASPNLTASASEGTFALPSPAKVVTVNFTNRSEPSRGPPLPGATSPATSGPLMATIVLVAAVSLGGALALGTYRQLRRRS